jgi:phage terminase small subunit
VRGHNRKKPLAIVRLEGNPGKRKLPKPAEEVRAVPGAPQCPPDLNAAIKSEWAWAIPLLHAQGTLAQIDKGILQGYCWAYSMASKYGKSRDKQDLRLALNCYKQMQSFASQLGMSPSDRARLSIPCRKTEDETEKLLDKVE